MDERLSAPPQKAVTAVRPVPVEMTTKVDTEQDADGNQLVRLAFVNPTGLFVCYMSAAAAENYADAISQAASRARILLPPVPILGRNGDGGH